MQVPSGEAEDERRVIVALPLHALQRDRLEQLGSILSNHPGYCESSSPSSTTTATRAS